jgi:hypothetical protein
MVWLGGFGLAGLLGGGGGQTAMPHENLALPDVDDVRDAKSDAVSREQAIDHLMGSPESQVQTWAGSTSYQREALPLEKLSIEQRVWLQSRSDDELKLLAAAKTYQVYSALTGRPDAIKGVASYGSEPDEPGPLTARILAFRDGGRSSPPHSMAH